MEVVKGFLVCLFDKFFEVRYEERVKDWGD